ncbi:CsbD family protein [Runella sp.]|uniref:CsbD family protein n=1 Tax=Runella sp. TaxID=1960881 RepID=UPI003D0B5D30
MAAPQQKNVEIFKITGNWDSMARLLKDKFAQLTDADLKFEPGKENELIRRVELRLNKKREEVINIIKKGQPEKV